MVSWTPSSAGAPCDQRARRPLCLPRPGGAGRHHDRHRGIPHHRHRREERDREVGLPEMHHRTPEAASGEHHDRRRGGRGRFPPEAPRDPPAPRHALPGRGPVRLDERLRERRVPPCVPQVLLREGDPPAGQRVPRPRRNARVRARDAPGAVRRNETQGRGRPRHDPGAPLPAVRRTDIRAGPGELRRSWNR